MNESQQPHHNFEAHAHESLDFLCKDHGFQCVKSRTTRVRYESHAVFFEVTYAVDHDGEVIAMIGRIDFLADSPGTTECLDFRLVLAVVDPQKHTECYRAVPFFIANSEEQVRTIFSYYAAGLRAHGQLLLKGDTDAYDWAKSLRFWHAPPVPDDVVAKATGRRWWHFW